MQNPEIRLTNLGYDQSDIRAYWDKVSVFKKWCRDNWITICKNKIKIQLYQFLKPYTSINSKLPRNLNRKKSKIVQILKESK